MNVIEINELHEINGDPVLTEGHPLTVLLVNTQKNLPEHPKLRHFMSTQNLEMKKSENGWMIFSKEKAPGLHKFHTIQLFMTSLICNEQNIPTTSMHLVELQRLRFHLEKTIRDSKATFWAWAETQVEKSIAHLKVDLACTFHLKQAGFPIQVVSESGNVFSKSDLAHVMQHLETEMQADLHVRRVA